MKFSIKRLLIWGAFLFRFVAMGGGLVPRVPLMPRLSCGQVLRGQVPGLSDEFVNAFDESLQSLVHSYAQRLPGLPPAAERELYNFSTTAIAHIVAALPDAERTLFMQAFAQYPPELRVDILERLVDFKGNWQSDRSDVGTLKFGSPHQLAEIFHVIQSTDPDFLAYQCSAIRIGRATNTIFTYLSESYLDAASFAPEQEPRPRYDPRDNHQLALSALNILKKIARSSGEIDPRNGAYELEGNLRAHDDNFTEAVALSRDPSLSAEIDTALSDIAHTLGSSKDYLKFDIEIARLTRRNFDPGSISFLNEKVAAAIKTSRSELHMIDSLANMNAITPIASLKGTEEMRKNLKELCSETFYLERAKREAAKCQSYFGKFKEYFGSTQFRYNFPLYALYLDLGILAPPG